MSELQHYIPGVQEDPWEALKAFTSARIALGRTGQAVPLKEVLNFRLAHAHARDAVYSAMETDMLTNALRSNGHTVHLLHSMAADRYEYLQRPDKGRRLDKHAEETLKEANKDKDICFVITDGLSATAINEQVLPLLGELLPLIKAAGFGLGDFNLVQQGRVAVGDEVGALQRARAVIVLIGERPGLSAADSLGAYLTYSPQPGLTDDARNCISNIRPGGLTPQMAAGTIMYLLKEAFRLQLSGVNLKDEYQSGLSGG
ncbi:ethanolamine ammonia-lyase subunit EutC [uncultured Chitinophaga sp.]|uniref:ethanolamine ammonia-lyase subunit EutC n=1 Tax=uncultured Chitinophaga sp. TaxID=339340 RepID=UPI0025D5E31B|nr:ethanolamine ammonia-lyase subunit EutC [uncultured Chitinophaga sp.]